MSTQPNAQQLNEARLKGFRNSLSHHAAPIVQRLEKSYTVQAERRERNVTNFRKQVGGK